MYFEQGWPDLNHGLIKQYKSPKMTFFSFLNVFLLFVVHNCRNEEINVAKSD